jgi:hypothetical protein
MHKNIIALAGLAAALAAASGTSAEEKTMNLSRNAKSGVDSLLAYAGRWDRNCHELPIKINFTRQPTQGMAWSVEDDRVIPTSTPAMGDTGQCAGKTVKSKKIMYRSAPGYRGSDTVSYVSEGGGLVIHTTITVSVQ